MARIYTNTANHTALDGSLTSGATTITLLSVSGWPVPAAGETALACIDYDSATGSVREVVSYTGISGNDLTGVTRGVDQTTAQSHSTGASVVHVASAVDVSGSSGALEFELATEFTLADHAAVKAFGGTFTPRGTTALVTVGISGRVVGLSHAGSWFAWNSTVTPGDPLLNGDDFASGSGPYVTGTSYKTLGAIGGSGNVGNTTRKILLTGLTPGTETTWEVDVAAIGYFDSVATGDFPVDLAMAPDNEFLYVTNFTSGSVQKIKPIWKLSSDRALEVVETFTGHSGAYGIATHPTDPTRLFVSRFSADQVVEINPLNGGSVTNTVSITDPYFLHVEPDGSRLWVVRQGSNQVQPITLSTFTAGTAITTSTGPWKPQSTSTDMYIPCSTGNAVDRINFSTLTRTALATGASTAPVAVSITPNDDFLWVLEQTAARARQINLSTFTITAQSITGMGTTMADLAVSPSGKTLMAGRGGATNSLQTYVLPPAGVMYEKADLTAIARMTLGHDGSIYMLGQTVDTLYVFHGVELLITPNDDFWAGYLSVLIER